MTSFNHYALGAVADFLHRVVAGIAPAEPGYRKVLFRPRPGGGISTAAARLTTADGEAAIRWERSGTDLVVDLTVPDGVRGIVEIDGCPVTEVGPGQHQVVGTCRAVEDDPVRPPRRTPFDDIGASGPLG
jgi:alpha-L-rhamnosidase